MHPDDTPSFWRHCRGLVLLFLYANFYFQFILYIIYFVLVFIMSYSSDINSIFSIDVVDSLAQQLFRLTHADELEVAMSRNLISKSLKGLKKEIELSEEVEDTMTALEYLLIVPDRYTLSYIELPISIERLLPSVIQAPNWR